MSRERDGFRPRFTHPASVEGEIASRFKALSEVEQQQKELLEKQMKEAREKLEVEVENLLHEHRAKIMRQGNESLSVCLSLRFSVYCPLVSIVL